MTLIVVGVSHQATPLDVRERLAFPLPEIRPALDQLQHFVHEGVLLSTCNRTEIYADVGHARTGREALVRFLAEARGMAPAEITDTAFSLGEVDAVRHLFRVSAGVESMIVGEPQILGQIRSAFELARTHQSLSASMSRLFEQALAVGKRVRTETAIAQNAVSLSYAAVALARDVLGDLRDRTVLVIGAGKMGDLAVQTLRAHGVNRLMVASRVMASAARLAARLGGAPRTLANIEEALVEADIVISSTAAGHHVLEAETVARAQAARNGRLLLLVDIAVPRDIDPAAGRLNNVHLYNIDELESICARNMELRRLELPRVETLISEEVARFESWRENREIAPVISALVDRAEGIRQAELERALARLAGLSERDRNVVQALTVSLVNKLLHTPIMRLKEHGTTESARTYARTVTDLFALVDE